MALTQESKQIQINESEIKPNLYAANVLVGVVLVLVTVVVLNETGVFVVDKTLMRVGLAVTMLLFAAVQVIVRRKKGCCHPASKYVIMAIVLVLTLVLTALMNIHAVLAFVLPLLLAAQYRSSKVSAMAIAGSCICCFAAPVLSYLMGTWGLEFMIGLTEAFCRVSVSTVPQGNTLGQVIGSIFLYWSLPQCLILGAFGFILYAVTRIGIDNVRDQMRISDLSGDLNAQLEHNLSVQEKMLCSMSDIMESRDSETGGHVRRTSEVVRLLTDAMRRDPNSGVSQEFCDNVIKAAPMHDLGKISVPDAILRKSARLTEEEFEQVKLHPSKSAEIIERVLTGVEDDGLVETAKNLAKYHHERMDGTGYPEQLKGEEIPLEARIMAIADVYDALVSERCYKDPLSFDAAFQIMETAMGNQFDPKLNEYFLACREQIEAFYRK